MATKEIPISRDSFLLAVAYRYAPEVFEVEVREGLVDLTCRRCGRVYRRRAADARRHARRHLGLGWRQDHERYVRAIEAGFQPLVVEVDDGAATVSGVGAAAPQAPI